MPNLISPQGQYTRSLRAVEKDIQDISKRVNELAGIKVQFSLIIIIIRSGMIVSPIYPNLDKEYTRDAENRLHP